MPPDDKRLDLADELRSMVAKIDAIYAALSGGKKQLGRPPDNYAEILSEMAEIGRLTLREAIKNVQETLPETMSLDLLVAVNRVMDQLSAEYACLLSHVMKEVATFHYKEQRKVKNPKSAARSARHRHTKIKPSG